MDLAGTITVISNPVDIGGEMGGHYMLYPVTHHEICCKQFPPL